MWPVGNVPETLDIRFPLTEYLGLDRYMESLPEWALPPWYRELASLNNTITAVTWTPVDPLDPEYREEHTEYTLYDVLVQHLRRHGWPGYVRDMTPEEYYDWAVSTEVFGYAASYYPSITFLYRVEIIHHMRRLASPGMLEPRLGALLELFNSSRVPLLYEYTVPPPEQYLPDYLTRPHDWQEVYQILQEYTRAGNPRTG